MEIDDWLIPADSQDPFQSITIFIERLIQLINKSAPSSLPPTRQESLCYETIK